jgi:hypothetical protein
MTLQEIGLKHSTDKASHHFYLPLYERLFKPYVFPNILEIGVQFGASLRTWREYFPYSFILGIDTIDNRIPRTDDDTKIVFGDAYTRKMVYDIKGLEKLYDIIIDDGDHLPEHQAFVVGNYHRLLSPRGLLIIEDCTDIEPLKVAVPSGYQFTAVEMIEGKSLVDSKLFIIFK